MKFTLSWLYEHLDTQSSTQEILDTLNQIGLEVEKVNDPNIKLSGFEVAEILSTKPHPDADKLKICTVKSSDGEQELVCGAPNARQGLKGILAKEGAMIPSNGMIIGKAKIRGVESRGMMCSGQELEFSTDDSGIIELPNTAQIGQSATQALGLETMVEIAITPNRPDCLGVRGIARDLAAAGIGKLKNTTLSPITSNQPNNFNITIATQTCPIFAGQIIRNIKNIPSPDWLAKRLIAIGLHPINALVDITNYISYDYGRPLHVYDMAKLKGDIIVRNAKKEESFQALDGKDYSLNEEDCVIADSSSVLGLGGIMGGMDSGSSLGTVDVLVESAWFDPVIIAHTGRRHRIDSDARYRFERGVDPESVMTGLTLATKMILDICGGEPTKPIIAGNLPNDKKQITFNPNYVKTLTGMDLPSERMIEILQSLGFDVEDQQNPQWKVTVPSWRPDIDGKADLIEEIIRIYGLNHVPSVALPRSHAVTKPILTLPQKRMSLARRILATKGMVELITWSFISQKQAQAFGNANIKLSNPISIDLSYMRPSLLPGLLLATRRNIERDFTNLALFEAGQVFTGSKPKEQHMCISGIRYGKETPRHWSRASQSVDSFLAKADAEILLETFGVNISTLQIKRQAPAYYHPRRSAMLCRDPKTPLAYFGELHPSILEEFNLNGSVMAFEVFPENLPEPKLKTTRTKPAFNISNLQAVRRDFSFEISIDVDSSILMRAINGVNKKLISHLRLFDAFTGETITDGMKSLGVEVTLQPFEKTLTQEEIETISDKIIQVVEKATNGRLRR